MNLTPSPSYFRIEPMKEDRDQHTFAPNHQVLSSASTLSSASYHILFNSTQDHAGYYRTQLFQPHYQEGENHGAGSSYEIKNKVSNGLKLTLWKKEDQTDVPEAQKNINPVKYMGIMKKIKKNDRVAPKAEKLQPSLETDISSSSCSYNSSSSPIRVCADCNTTKTPLWRSGPKGPKSLCNACGIRQRKARRAVAAAAAAGTAVDQPPAVKIKLQQKDKIGKIKHSSNLKKRCKMDAGSSNSGQKKLSFEDFLINLNNNLSFQRVFPQDEKDAAILLMALSSGLLHG